MENRSETNSADGSLVDSEYDDDLAIDVSELPSPVLPHHNVGNQRGFDFRWVHQPPIKFKASQRRVFIPGQEIELDIIDYERSVTTHMFHPNLYTIQLRHGDFVWTVKKRFNEISQLHQQLRLFRTSLNIPIPTKAHRKRRTTFKHDANKYKDKIKPRRFQKIPRFPSTPEALVPFESLGHRIQQIEEYLRNLLKLNIYRNHYELANFFEVSHLSFILDLGDKGKEGLVQKRTRSLHPGASSWNCFGCLNGGCCLRCNFLCGDVCGSWRTRWLIVKDNFVAYVRPKDGLVKAVLLFDSAFEVSSGIFPTNILLITNLSRQIVVKCPTRRTAREWQTYIKEKLRNEGRDFTSRCRYMSYAPPRPSATASWLVDGSAYMSAVASALEQATEEIFIADWWLSPEIQLRRPPTGQLSRLDRLLQRKAEEGVKICILLYKEVEMALGINSFYSKQRLIAECKKPENLKTVVLTEDCEESERPGVNGELDELASLSLLSTGVCVASTAGCFSVLPKPSLIANIKGEASQAIKNIIGEYLKNILCNEILRHPDHAKVGVFFWAHHEKLVIVDQTLAFLGGIDLCYGRWDDHFHRLTDLGRCPEDEFGSSFLNVTLANNALTTSILSLKMPDEKATSVEEVMVQPSSENIKCNTPEMERKSLFNSVRSKMWNFYSSGDSDCEDDDLKQSGNLNQSMTTLETNLSQNGNIKVISKQSLDYKCSDKLWIGKDYTNFILKDFEKLDQPFQDLVDRSKTARMPWHDVGVMVHGSAARDLARHFIQRWNAVKAEKAKMNPSYPYLLPKAYRNFTDFWIAGHKQHKVTCQVVRSLSHWSSGSVDPEFWEGSIHEAYIDIINKAEHYIYIENQFFITGGSVRNQVGDALVRRIIRAYKEGTTFRVFVILPLLPGFEGEVGSPSGSALHAITHWNYSSICRGKNSIIGRLRSAGISDPSEYITFHGLRNYDELSNTPVTELIYVHSKLLIADDKIMICGSANINDRSLLGKRDSEIAVVISDEDFKGGKMNGESYLSGRCCGSLRRALFREHLGISGPKLADPICEEFYRGLWLKTACRNTEIYEKVFRCLPSDEIKRFEDIKNPSHAPLVVTDVGAARELLQQVQGHLVMFPLDFLRDQILTPTPGTVEGMMPMSLWT